jgi:xylan 1,4-beta-xylosidase
VGSGHALLGLRADWREQLISAREKLGFERIRFHGIFDDDMSVYSEDSSGAPVYSWFNVDQHYDFLLSIGMRPIVELSFMPELLASFANETIFHYKGGISPPKSYDKWGGLISAFATHLIGRYGLEEVSQWDFEVWNEPNCGFWTGNQQEYFRLLEVTYKAIKSVSSQLRVGGPATCQLQWIPETLQFTQSRGIKLDFISSHIYPTDFGDQNVSRTVMEDKLSIANQQSQGTPLYITEFNSGLYCCLHDTPFASAFLISQLPKLDPFVHVLSYWTFSDIFEEWPFKSAPFQSGFGLQTIYGIPKPAFRAYELLHRAGTTRHAVHSSNVAPTIDFFVSSNSTHIMAFISNWNTPGNMISPQRIQISFSELTSNDQAFIERIDDNHCNPQQTWIDQGSPMYPTQQQIAAQLAASQLTRQSIFANSQRIFSFSVPPLGVVALTIAI